MKNKTIMDAEANLNKCFPKGDKRRGEALLVYATAKLSERERCRKELIEEAKIWIKERNGDKVMTDTIKIFTSHIEDRIKEDKN